MARCLGRMNMLQISAHLPSPTLKKKKKKKDKLINGSYILTTNSNSKTLNAHLLGSQQTCFDKPGHVSELIIRVVSLLPPLSRGLYFHCLTVSNTPGVNVNVKLPVKLTSICKRVPRCWIRIFIITT